MSSYSLEKIDWVQFIERERTVYLFATFLRPYGPMVEEVTGSGFKHELNTHAGSTGIFYRSKKELEAVSAYFAELIEQEDQRFYEWCREGYRSYKAAPKLIAECAAQESEQFTADWFQLAQDRCEQIMLYTTVIPYLALVGVEFAENQGKTGPFYTEVRELFEPLRADSWIPQASTELFPLFWQAAARKLGITDSSLLSYTAPDEIRNILAGQLNIDEKELRQRQEWCAFWWDPTTSQMVFSTDRQLAQRLGLEAEVITQEKLTGTVAFRGATSGRVKIINSAADMRGFEEGDILVSFHTNPSLMPALIKCGGIVTDEGGIGCHAAIVSRELKKPCVIATKYATKVLRDGDLVEVDAVNGVVTVLQRALVDQNVNSSEGHPREGWEGAFEMMANKDDDVLLDPFTVNKFDDQSED